MTPIPILTYHQIGEAPPKGGFMRSLHVAAADFSRQMSWLRRLGYRGLSMSDLMPYLRGDRKGRVVGITFDDGYRNNLELALPVLQSNGFTATCYVVSNLLGSTNVWDEPLGARPVPLMTADEIRQWAQAGMEIGSHTQHHVDLRQCDPAQARQEIIDSRHRLQDILGRPVSQFCYPYGHYAPEHVDWVREAGYLAATTTRRGRCLAQSPHFELPRVPVVRSTHLIQLALKLWTVYEDRRG